MRQVIVSHIMSVDGYYEGPGRNVMALNMDEASTRTTWNGSGLDARRFDGSNNVLLRYSVSR